MDGYIELPWSVEQTIENLEGVRAAMIKRIRTVNLDGEGEEDVKELNYDFDKAIEALKKEVPRQGYYEDDTEADCPTCGSLIEDYNVTTITRCPECGQRIKWEN